MLAVTQRALGQVYAPDLDLQPALERPEVHFPSAAPFLLQLSCLSLAAAVFPSRMSGSLFGRSYSFLQKALSNLWCRVSDLFLTTAKPTCSYLFLLWFLMELAGVQKFISSVRETL